MDEEDAARGQGVGHGVDADAADLVILRGQSIARTSSCNFSQQSLRAVLHLEQYSFVKDPQAGQEGPTALHATHSPRTSTGGIPSARNNSFAPPINLKHESSLVTPDLLHALRKSQDRSDFDCEQLPSILDRINGINLSGAASISEMVQSGESNSIVISDDLPTAMKRQLWSIKDFNLLRQVHRGYASDVYEATCKRTDKRVALKVYAVDQLEDIPRVQLAREIRLHSKEDLPESQGDGGQGTAHQNGSSSAPPDPKGEGGSVKTCRAVVLVVEWAGKGNLLRFIQKQGGTLTEAKAINLVLFPLLKSLQYLHSQGIVHRDIKPENMIFDDDMVLKMADFGLALDLTEERANTRAGTLDYMAPEVLLCPTKTSPADHKFEAGSRHYTTGADAWAVGAIFYELLTGIPPFRAETMNATARNIINCEISFPEKISDPARDFISACLVPDPSDRPTVVELIKHELLTAMRRRASYRSAAMRSNTFVDFIQQQQKQQEREEVSRQGTGSSWLDDLHRDSEFGEDASEDDN